MEKTIEYYMGLPYTFEMTPGLNGGWVVSAKEFPGCISQGDNPQDAVDMIREAMQGWLEIALEDGISVPEPRPPETYSGKFVARVPRSLHRDLVDAAEREGISLNQFVSTALARAVGEETGARATRSATPDGLAEQLMVELLNELSSALAKEERAEALRIAKRVEGALEAAPESTMPAGVAARLLSLLRVLLGGLGRTVAHRCTRCLVHGRQPPALPSAAGRTAPELADEGGSDEE